MKDKVSFWIFRAKWAITTAMFKRIMAIQESQKSSVEVRLACLVMAQRIVNKRDEWLKVRMDKRY